MKLCVNSALFCNNNSHLEYSIAYWLDNFSGSNYCIEDNKSIDTYIQSFIENLDLPPRSSKSYLNLFKKYFSEPKERPGLQHLNEGTLYSISISPSVVDQILYIGRHVAIDIDLKGREKRLVYLPKS